MAWDLKDYEPVEDRLREFWSEHPTGRLETELIHHAEGEYIVKASVWCFDGEARGPDATGLAHDSTEQLPQNMKASALEVCETSAIGRALANLGYAAKGKRPSREEMQKSTELEPGTALASGSPEGDGMGEVDEAGSEVQGEGATGSASTSTGDPNTPVAGPVSTPGSASNPDLDRHAKDFRDYLRATYTQANALLMARQLFETASRKIPNLTKLSFEELQAIDTEFKNRAIEVPA